MQFYQNDAERVQAAKRCVWLLILFTLMAFYGMWSDNRRTAQDTEIALHAATTTGDVFETRSGRGGKWLYYTYQVDGAHYEGKASGFGPFSLRPPVGAALTVTYSTANPSLSVAGDIAQQPGSRAMWYLLLALLCGSGAAFFAYRASTLSTDST